MNTTDPPRTPAEWLVHCHGDLVRFCHRYVGQHADAEDVVQDVAAKMSGREDISNPRSWMFRVARNRCLNILRDRRGGPDDSGSFFTASNIESPRTGPRTALDRSERDESVRSALAAMPRDHAEVLTLRYFEGFNRREIAEVLERPESEVKVLLAQARAEMARKLRHSGTTRP